MKDRALQLVREASQEQKRNVLREYLQAHDSFVKPHKSRREMSYANTCKHMFSIPCNRYERLSGSLSLLERRYASYTGCVDIPRISIFPWSMRKVTALAAFSIG
jgi:hypothetical protein